MKCDECIINQNCSLRAIDPSNCSKPIKSDNLLTCDICGKQYLPRGATVEVHSGKVICPTCAQQMAACGACAHSKICTFETDPSPIPKIVVQTVQQGNMRIQQQVRNPAREEITCKNCKCYNEEYHCMRTFLSRCVNFTI